jgi:hypothetical protein
VRRRSPSALRTSRSSAGRRRGLEQSGILTPELGDGVQPSPAAFAAARQGKLVETRLLFANAGFSLAYASFKSGFAVILHSREADCLYYITGGSIRLGGDELGVSDGFFVLKDVPYTYVAGAEGGERSTFATPAASTRRSRQRRRRIEPTSPMP